MFLFSPLLPSLDHVLLVLAPALLRTLSPALQVRSPPAPEVLSGDPYHSGSASREPQHAALPDASQWDKYGVNSEGIRVQQPASWVNPVHRMDTRSGRYMPAWDNAWGWHDGPAHSVAPPPPRPDSKPPYSDWQQGRADTTRHRAVLTTATGVSALPHLGFGGGSFTRGPLHSNLSGASPWDREVLSSVGNRSRQPTAWDNLAHRSEHRSGRPMSTCDNAWGRQEREGYSATPRLDQLRFEQPRYEKMKAPRFDGSDAANVNLAATTKTDEAGGFVAAGGFELVSPDSVSSDGSRLPDDASHLLGSSDVEGVDEGRIAAVTCDRSPNAKTMEVSSENSSCDKSSGMLKKLLASDTVNKTMSSELSCEANQLPSHLICVNARPLSSGGLVKLQSSPNPPKKLKPGKYWCDRVSGFLGKEGEKPSQIITAEGGDDEINRHCSTKLDADARLIPPRKWSYKAEWRHSTIPLCAKQLWVAFYPGGEAPPKLRFAMFISVSWFPP